MVPIVQPVLWVWFAWRGNKHLLLKIFFQMQLVQSSTYSALILSVQLDSSYTYIPVSHEFPSHPFQSIEPTRGNRYSDFVSSTQSALKLHIYRVLQFALWSGFFPVTASNGFIHVVMCTDGSFFYCWVTFHYEYTTVYSFCWWWALGLCPGWNYYK